MFDSGQCGDDPLQTYALSTMILETGPIATYSGIGNLAILQRNVEVHTYEDPLSSELQISNSQFFRQGHSGNSEECVTGDNFRIVRFWTDRGRY
jgi:hypothetical protein